MPRPSLAIILPPSEAFSPDAAGALGLLARRHASFPGAFDCTVFGPPPPTSPFPCVRFVAVQPAGWSGMRTRRYGNGLVQALQSHRLDLIEVHNRPDLALMLASRFPGTPVTLILNNDPQCMRAARTEAERATLLEELAGVACCSAYLATRLPSCSGKPPIVLPNCLDFSELPAPSEERENLILFAGRIVADKGAGGFVRACAQALPHLPGWRAEMIGGDRFGPKNPETPYLRALHPHARHAGVAMLGYRPHHEVLAAMARAAIVVVPSRWREPFGLVAVEAMACGAALLCSNRGGLAEITGDVACEIDPDDIAEFARAIVETATDIPRRAAMARAGLARARLFSLDAVGPKLDAWRQSFLLAASRPISAAN